MMNNRNVRNFSCEVMCRGIPVGGRPGYLRLKPNAPAEIRGDFLRFRQMLSVLRFTTFAASEQANGQSHHCAVCRIQI